MEPNPARSDQVLLSISQSPPHSTAVVEQHQINDDPEVLTCHRDDALGLTDGMELSEPQVQALQRSLFRRECREKALSLLSRRDHAERELQRKLLQRSFSADVVAEVCAELNSTGLLDDQRFVSSWIAAHRGRRPRGLHFLAAECAERGVSREDFAEARDALLAETPEFELKECRLAMLRAARSGGNPEKTRQTLKRWGFSRATIRSVENSSPPQGR